MSDSKLETAFDTADQTLSPLDTKRHSLAHILGAAVSELFSTPDQPAKLGIGPVIEHGFYYDFELDHQLTEDDLELITSQMRKIIGRGESFIRESVSRDQAIERLKEKQQKYKIELVENLPAESEITFYHTGEFSDLCRGPHVTTSKELQGLGWKLTRLAGAYWRGSEKNPMLQRVYGVAFDTVEDLKLFEYQEAEALKRDHRKLGKELKLFTISDLVGAGLPLLQPNGAIIKKSLEDYLWDLHQNLGYQRVWSPHLAKEDLYVTSGHAGHYLDDMFSVFGGSSQEKFHLKPMNCPHHMQIFADNQFSYRDMPVRYFEPATVYRDEKTGQLSGLTRVRSITQDDGHLFCRVDQIGQEVSMIVSIIKEFYTTMGMWDGYWVRLSVRDSEPNKWLGGDEVWSLAETALEDAAKSNDLNYRRGEGEAAFYGPKLDFIFKDAIGREWQLATIQCDFNLPERFKLAFTNDRGQDERPVVIHRAISGSLERFMGVMIEHFAGNFPFWLSPEQIVIATVSENFITSAKALAQTISAHGSNGLRVLVDDSNESIGKKVRLAAKNKVPFILVYGEKEASGAELSLRVRGQENSLNLSTDAFITHCLNLNRQRNLNLI